MINVRVLSDEGIIVVEPSGPLKEADFEKLAKEIDAYSEDKGRLVGLIIHTKSFPGWNDFSAFFQHMKFVKEHHKQIQRVAIVTDSKLGEIGPGIAKHFVSAQLKHFSFDDFDKAKQWMEKAV
jgi:hypothetical protein